MEIEMETEMKMPTYYLLLTYLKTSMGLGQSLTLLYHKLRSSYYI